MSAAPPLRVLVVALAAFVVTVTAVVVVLVQSPQLSTELAAQLGAHAAAIATGVVAAVPAVAAWLTGRAVRATQADHQQRLDTITAQTNGVLDQRIRDGVRAELQDAGLVVGAPPGVVIPDVIPDQPAPSPAS